MNRRPSPLDNEQCRQCSSFSDYVKVTKKKLQNDGGAAGVDKNNNPQGTPTRRLDCPLDKDQLGNSSWGLLHTMAAKYPDKPTATEQKEMKTFFCIFSKFYPCEHCAQDLREDLKCNPPQVESNEVLSQWLCRLHNRVNVKIGKPVFDCTKVNERWRDGWADGSCDYY